MGNFKESSSSSGFVSVITTVLILLAVIINIYPATATATATAAASLETVEEVAKDQGTTEVAGVHHHEIRERVLLLGGALKPIIGGLGRVAKGVLTHAKPRVTVPSQGLTPRSPLRFTPDPRLKPSPRKSFDLMLDQYYQFLDQSCGTLYCYPYPSAVGGNSCQCRESEMAGYIPCATEASHCCKGKNSYCAACCVGEATYGTPRPDIFP